MTQLIIPKKKSKSGNNYIPVNIPKIFIQDKINVKKCLDTAWISSEGPYVKTFENKFKFLQSLVLQTKIADNNFSMLRTEINLIPNNEFIKKGNDFLNSINIPQDAKIICFIKQCFVDT